MHILYKGNNIDVDDELSFKCFTNRVIRDHFDSKYFEGKVIYRSTFYHESPQTKSFDDAMTGVTFIDCNLDNLILPPTNVYINCSNKYFVNDPAVNEDFELDKISGNQLGPINVKAEMLSDPWYSRFYAWITSWL